jgi:lysophospholipase L1-like esterase
MRSMRGITALSAAVMGTLAVEAVYAVRRKLPILDEFDGSGTIGPPDGTPLSMVILGDSSCTGTGVAEPSEIWFRLVAARLADRGYRVTIRSFAVGGARSSNALQTQVPAAEALSPDLTIIAVGTNDVIHQVPLTTLERNLDEIISRMARVSKLVLVAGVGDLGTVPRLLPPLRQLATRRGRRGDFVQARAAQRHGAIKTDLWGAVAEAFRTDPAIFSADLFHPAAPGHRVWAEAAWNALEPHFSGA